MKAISQTGVFEFDVHIMQITLFHSMTYGSDVSIVFVLYCLDATDLIRQLVCPVETNNIASQLIILAA